MLCLRCHQEIPAHHLIMVFVREPDTGPIWRPNYRTVPERMCRECGKNNSNSLSEQEYEELKATFRAATNQDEAAQRIRTSQPH